MATVQQLIGKINPELYAENGKELLKKYGSKSKIPADEVQPKPVSYIPGEYPKFFKGSALAKHTLVYDSSSETLEPIYFFILDLMNEFGLGTEKLIDNFSSSPGSGHFSELGQRATIMQQQGSKLLGDINMVLRSVLNLIYDLKDFRTRLQSYEDLNSKEKNTSEAARLSLKQIWMDKVDIQKGNSSIKAMGLGQGGFVTLIDAFLASKDEKDVENLDLNERVKRILKPRINEFNNWIKSSEIELKKRYEIEKTYLKSQVNSLKLYSRWAKPYLQAAKDLEHTEGGREPALVKTFNTIMLNLTLLGKNKLKPKESSLEGDLPEEFTKESFLRTLKREYFSCVLVEFKFRGIPQKVAQQSHFTFGGRAEVTFSAYALNNEELKMLDKELENSDMNDALKLIEGVTKESLDQLQDEINYYLDEETQKKELEEKKKESSDDSNPFLALIGGYNKKSSPKKETKKDDFKEPSKDNWIEKEHLRTLAAKKAVETIFSLFDIYKKAHTMPSYT